MEAAELYQLLSQTQIEDFDEIEEAFKLLDVEGDGFLTIDAFKQIFEKLDLGKIDKQDEDIFKDVTNADQDGRITLENFRKILSYQDGRTESNKQLSQNQEMDDHMDEMDYDDEDEM